MTRPGFLTLCGSASLLALSISLTGCGGGGGNNNPATRMVFVSDKAQSGNKEIYLGKIPANVSPSQLPNNVLDSADRLTNTILTWQDQSPSIPPTTATVNQNLVAFQSDRPKTSGTGTLNAIWTVDSSDPAHPVQQRTFPVLGEDDTNPVWSHDGKKIAFVRTIAGNSDIYILDTTSSAPPQQLTYDTRNDGGATWSPNDSKIAFSSNRLPAALTDYNIHIIDVNAAGSGAEGAVTPSLTPNTGPDENPDWTDSTELYPGGSIIYQGRATPGASGIIYSMPIAGASGGQKQHTSGSTDDGWPSYSPDGKYIVYHRILGNRQIFVKAANASFGGSGNEFQINTPTLVASGWVQPSWGK